MSLDKQVVIVTGAASGIGLAAVQACLKAGAKVCATDLDQAKLQQACSADQSNTNLLLLQQDVCDESRWEAVFEQAGSSLGRVTALVNNAGIGVGSPIVEQTLEQWRHLMAVNLDSVFLGTRAALKIMSQTKQPGSIINISSVAGLRGMANASAYCASKGGVRLFTKATALECAEFGWPIRVNSVHPGIIDTPIWDGATKLVEAAASQGEKPAQMIAKQMAPMNRPGTPAEVADMIVFLVSDQSRYVTGQEFVVDGGLTAR